jgi:hypothetical protein
MKIDGAEIFPSGHDVVPTHELEQTVKPYYDAQPRNTVYSTDVQ